MGLRRGVNTVLLKSTVTKSPESIRRVMEEAKHRQSLSTCKEEEEEEENRKFTT
jgi:hypothetical protein